MGDHVKAYIIKITLVESNPLIWRRVIVPAEITFKSLHEVIQFSMGWLNNRLYDFNVNEEKLRITCDEEAIFEYERYSKMKLTTKNDPYGFIAKMIEITPKLSTNVKIDNYLTKWKTIEYVYDFGDYWKHDITLEEVVDNYEYSYPICIEGEGACPPDDVGGISGYEQFLEVMNDKNHPKYDGLKAWAENQHYQYNFDIEKTNRYMADIL